MPASCVPNFRHCRQKIGSTAAQIPGRLSGSLKVKYLADAARWYVICSAEFPFFSPSCRLMLYKCANPLCSRLFRRMSQGRLFQLPRNSAGESPRSSTRHTPEYFWLCDKCKLHFTLAFHPNSGIFLVPASQSAPWKPSSAQMLASKFAQNSREHSWRI